MSATGKNEQSKCNENPKKLKLIISSCINGAVGLKRCIPWHFWYKNVAYCIRALSITHQLGHKKWKYKIYISPGQTDSMSWVSKFCSKRDLFGSHWSSNLSNQDQCQPLVHDGHHLGQAHIHGGRDQGSTTADVVTGLSPMADDIKIRSSPR